MDKSMKLINLNFLFTLTIAIFFYTDSNNASDRISDIKVPEGYKRIVVDDQGFASYLRHLKLKPDGTKVKYFDGREKPSQNVHYRIIDLDIGQKDLQQCADAIIRLRAEYLYCKRDYKSIHFNFTSGDTAKYSQWINGFRPKVNNNIVSWIQVGPRQNNYNIFRKYLETVFIYSGSYSLKRELNSVTDIKLIQIGDIFIQGGFPGHAIIIVDMAKDTNNNHIAILLAQSYMPAQDIHILVNENNSNMNPWYLVGQGDKLHTPEWIFDWSDLYQFK
jgi:hypothetical protein